MNIAMLCQDILRYLSGENVDFSKYELDLSDMTPFQRDVLEQTRKIPYGETITYGELAKSIGRAGGARAVGQALSKNPYPIIIPCHRIVSSSGIGGYCGETEGKKIETKKKLLEMERQSSGNKDQLTGIR